MQAVVRVPLENIPVPLGFVESTSRLELEHREAAVDICPRLL